eukprot:TRINITY_DN5480_c0_g1_i2.p2 TRINITY_DN5480_c0_g1~~TRINITY_DN5480_c0_g1_i2.p2  ORF type:complete len:142 (-),score=35.74 TRINITY_DN5480_c0_g1_i2:108-533(-)
MEQKGFMSDYTTLSLILEVCGELLRKEDAIFFFTEMKDRGYYLGAKDYNVLISLHTGDGEVERALEIVQEMERDNVKPNFCTFQSVYKAFKSKNRLEEAEEWLQRLTPRQVVAIKKKEENETKGQNANSGLSDGDSRNVLE